MGAEAASVPRRPRVAGLTFSLVYSYLNASVGFNRDARFAGNMPNIKPTAHDTPNATTMDTVEIGT